MWYTNSEEIYFDCGTFWLLVCKKFSLNTTKQTETERKTEKWKYNKTEASKQKKFWVSVGSNCMLQHKYIHSLCCAFIFVNIMLESFIEAFLQSWALPKSSQQSQDLWKSIRIELIYN
jgi:hypothetical protein